MQNNILSGLNKEQLEAAQTTTGALLILFFGSRVKPNTREAITLTAAVSMTAVIFSMVPAVLAGQEYTANLWKLADGLNLTLRTDAAGMVFACIASALWILTSVYSIGYVRGHHEKNQTGYFAAISKKTLMSVVLNRAETGTISLN